MPAPIIRLASPRMMHFAGAGLIATSLIYSATANAAWGWEPVEDAALKAITHNMTWQGDGWQAHWKGDHSRQLISGDNTFNETWLIQDNGKIICSNGEVRGERCGTIESKKGVYRSKRSSGPGKGKRFTFKVYPTTN